MVKVSQVHMTGLEVSRRFAHRLKFNGWATDGMRLAFDRTSAGYVISPDGRKPGRAQCYTAVSEQRNLLSAVDWKLFCQESGIAPDRNQYLDFRRGYFYGMYLAYRHGCQVLRPGDRLPQIGPYVESHIVDALEVQHAGA